MELSARNARPALPPVLRSLSFSPVSSLFLDIHILQPPIIFAVIVMRDFFGSFLHNFLLLLPPLLSYSLPADLGTARLLSLESDIKEVQERWRQYRNIVTDGFFLNDSMIVLADYDTGEENREWEEGDEEIDFDFGKDETDLNETGADLEENGLEKGGFKETMIEMMEALADIQIKGDMMMGAIRSQRQLLYNVREEVKEAEEMLIMMEGQRKEEERMVKEIEKQRLLAEARTRMIQMEKEEVEKELEEVEREGGGAEEAGEGEGGGEGGAGGGGGEQPGEI